MGLYSNNPIRDRIICEDHDKWVTSIPDYGDEEEIDEQEEDRDEA